MPQPKTIQLIGNLEYIDRYKRLHVSLTEECKSKIHELKEENKKLDHLPFYEKDDDEDEKTYVKIVIPAYNHDNLEKYEMLIDEPIITKVKIVNYNKGANYGTGLVFRMLNIRKLNF
jgi:hypothetical protein